MKNPKKTPVFRSLEERLGAGKALRDLVPRCSHGAWKKPAKKRSPVALLEKTSRDRLPELIPIRYGRMVRSPFTFFRGAAALMASDLASSPVSKIRVQVCGDCHLMNFGLFATPERNLIFDINDFDETLPGPWEWDVKRLATSFVVAAREIGLDGKKTRQVAEECARAYRERMRECSEMSPLEVWYDRIDADFLVEMAPDAEIREKREEVISKARERIGDYLFPKISEEVAGRRLLVDQPPLLYHVTPEREPDFAKIVAEAMVAYRDSLPEERQVLFDRYRLEDMAIKVVGIGSVGTRCFIGLFFSAENHPLLLQFKEAGPSVLEPYAGKSHHENHGQRVVTGQRLMQSSSDIFLGWVRTRRGRDYYVRQLRDMKYSPRVEGATFKQVKLFAELCGRTLARAHAKSGDAALITGYLGKSEAMDDAIADFAVAYADQNERDHAALVSAVKSGRIQVIEED